MKSFKKMIATVLFVAMIMGALNITDVGNLCISTEAAGATKVSSDASGNVSGDASAEASGEASADASGDEAGNVGSVKKSTKVKATKKQTISVSTLNAAAFTVGNYRNSSVDSYFMTYNESDTKKKSIKDKISVTASGKGKITYKLLKGNKKIKVSKKGVITLKKGLKAGQYPIRIKVAENGVYKKAIFYVVIWVEDNRDVIISATYKGKTVKLDNAKVCLYNNPMCSTDDLLKAWGKPTKTKYHKSAAEAKEKSGYYGVVYKSGKSFVSIWDDYQNGKHTWTGVWVRLKDKNISVGGIKVGDSKAKCIKKLTKLYGRNNFIVSSDKITLFYNVYMPANFTFDKKGKLKKFDYWHS